MSEPNMIAEQAVLTCRVCGFSGEGDIVLTFHAPGDGETLRARRCPDCDSVELVDEVGEFAADETTIDYHVEVGSGIGTIAALIDSAGAAGGRRLLDVGCSYGYSLAYARFRGWDAVGVEPGPAGRRGRTELGVDIRTEYFTDDSELGEPFDVVISSEVLEHVPDPGAFLRAIRNRMTPHGQLVLTTPDAAVLTPDSDTEHGDVYAVLSPGLHHFVASRRGLTDLLLRSGFDSIQIDRVGVSHRVLARIDGAPVVDLGSSQDFTDFYRSIAKRSSGRVAIGLWSRAFRSAVARGDFPDARRVIRPMAAAFRAVEGYDVRKTRAVRVALASGASPSTALPGVLFAFGMLELLSGNAAHAVERFETALEGIAQLSGTLGPDADSDDVRKQSEYHRLLALARSNPEAVPAAVAGVTLPPERLARVFVELVARGRLAEGAALSAQVAEHIGAVVADPDPVSRRAGRDALQCLGTLAAQSGDPDTARGWFAALLATSEGSDDKDQLTRSARQELDLLPEATASPVSLKGSNDGGRIDAVASALSYLIDAHWSDPHGFFIDGWVHYEGDPGTELVIEAGGKSVPATRHRRDDLLAFWPTAATVTDSGFRVYVPTPPIAEFSVVATFAGTRRSMTVPMPDQRLPELDPGPSHIVAAERIAALGVLAPDGPVLWIGSRASSADVPSFADVSFGEREIVGMDIHPGFQVDIVGDAHRLSSVVDPGRFSIIFSESLLEHVSAPWIVARETAAVLPIGGLSIHTTPWVWPTHSEPNDFWRMSAAGLRLLFGPDLGFEVLESGGHYAAAVIPHPTWREINPDIASLLSPAITWVVARKVREPSPAASWPYDVQAGADRAREYPLDGLIPPPREQLP